jgi:hypothetical protein
MIQRGDSSRFVLEPFGEFLRGNVVRHRVLDGCSGMATSRLRPQPILPNQRWFEHRTYHEIFRLVPEN